MQQFGASVFYTVMRWHKKSEVDMSVPYTFLSSWLSVRQKLSHSAEIWRSSDKKKLGHFFGTPCNVCFLRIALLYFHIFTSVRFPWSIRSHESHYVWHIWPHEIKLSGWNLLILCWLVLSVLRSLSHRLQVLQPDRPIVFGFLYRCVHSGADMFTLVEIKQFAKKTGLLE